jgi:hypothetical protein
MIKLFEKQCHDNIKRRRFPVDTAFCECLNQHTKPGSVVGITTGYGLDGLGIESRWGARFSAPVQTGPGAHPASWTMGTGSFLGLKSGRGVTLTPHPILVPWSWKSRAITLPPLWTVRPVQSLSACTRVTFTLTNMHHLSNYLFQLVHISFSSSLSHTEFIKHKNSFMYSCGVFTERDLIRTSRKVSAWSSIIITTCGSEFSLR